MPPIRLIASLGSSFAAGPGIAPMADPVARRSARNYPHQLAERLGARLVDLTVSGATTANLIDTPQAMADGTSYPPQTDGVPVDAEVVTITAGGNDLGFIASMLYVALSRRVPDFPCVQAHAAEFSHGIPLPGAAAVEPAISGLTQVIEKVRIQAPDARILLVDYLTVVADYSSAAPAFTAKEVDRFLGIQQQLQRVCFAAADQTGTELVLASTISETHALGAPEPWVQPLAGEGSFHPNAAGMAAVAAELERRLAG